MNNQNINIVPTGKRSVMCPRCGKLLTWVNKSDKKHNKVSQKQYEKFMDLLKVGDSE